MVGCGLACPGGGGAGVSGCEFRGSGWVLGDPRVATRNTVPYIYIYVSYGYVFF